MNEKEKINEKWIDNKQINQQGCSISSASIFIQISKVGDIFIMYVPVQIDFFSPIHLVWDPPTQSIQECLVYTPANQLLAELWTIAAYLIEHAKMLLQIVLFCYIVNIFASHQQTWRET